MSSLIGGQGHGYLGGGGSRIDCTCGGGVGRRGGAKRVGGIGTGRDNGPVMRAGSNN